MHHSLALEGAGTANRPFVGQQRVPPEPAPYVARSWQPPPDWRRLAPVTGGAKKLLEDVLALPARERADLLATAAHSLEASDPEIEDAWRVEVLRRVETVRTGEAVLESWDDVRRAGRLG